MGVYSHPKRNPLVSQQYLQLLTGDLIRGPGRWSGWTRLPRAGTCHRPDGHGPVGLIDNAWAPSVAEVWIRRETRDSSFASLIVLLAKASARFWSDGNASG